jgi:hypothetical protein
MTATTLIDWAAAEQVAARLGARTRQLVAERDPDAVRNWAVRMVGECSAAGVSDVNWPRAASYLELGALVASAEEDHHDQPTEQLAQQAPGKGAT